MFKKLALIAAFVGLNIGVAHATTWKAVEASTTGAAQGGVTNYAINFPSATITNLNTTTFTPSGLTNVKGGLTFAGVTPSSGMVPVSQGSGSTTPPKFQWDGRINGPDTYRITSTTSTTATGTLAANTNLTGSHTTLSAGEIVIISVSGTCQIVASDGASMGLKRGSTVVGGTSGLFRAINPSGTTAMQIPCGFVAYDTPGSVGSFTYTVTFNSSSGGSFQFGESSRDSNMVIIGYPK